MVNVVMGYGQLHYVIKNVNISMFFLSLFRESCFESPKVILSDGMGKEKTKNKEVFFFMRLTARI